MIQSASSLGGSYHALCRGLSLSVWSNYVDANSRALHEASEILGKETDCSSIQKRTDLKFKQEWNMTSVSSFLGSRSPLPSCVRARPHTLDTSSFDEDCGEHLSPADLMVYFHMREGSCEGSGKQDDGGMGSSSSWSLYDNGEKDSFLTPLTRKRRRAASPQHQSVFHHLDQDSDSQFSVTSSVISRQNSLAYAEWMEERRTSIS
ncbi:hypothetical protein, conserved [Angomonas deanei]|uniref:Uncharacterized protein n=1 Tax=Angomonas deanei TaxID=59799 RepID=A0A7G2CI41_9TRYP|nr:hypothetical protein, conserved [Angomonas deanei]